MTASLTLDLDDWHLLHRTVTAACVAHRDTPVAHRLRHLRGQLRVLVMHHHVCVTCGATFAGRGKHCADHATPKTWKRVKPTRTL